MYGMPTKLNLGEVVLGSSSPLQHMPAGWTASASLHVNSFAEFLHVHMTRLMAVIACNAMQPSLQLLESEATAAVSSSLLAIAACPKLAASSMVTLAVHSLRIVQCLPCVTTLSRRDP